jgi:hypothetical protein
MEVLATRHLFQGQRLDTVVVEEVQPILHPVQLSARQQTEEVTACYQVPVQEALLIQVAVAVLQVPIRLVAAEVLGLSSFVMKSPSPNTMRRSDESHL